MREIEFRGKRIDNGEWGYGSLINNECWTEILVYYPKERQGTFHGIDKSTIGQYTGLKDINGVKIFEGDIIEELLSSGDPIRYVVGWSDKDACFTATILPITKYDNLVCGISKEWVSSKSVVGNIHDNPELLKGGEE